MRILNSKRAAGLVEDHDPLTDHQREYVDGLRDLASVLIEHPNIIPFGGVYACVRMDSRDALVAKAREVGGEWEDASNWNTLRVQRRFGSHQFALIADRPLYPAPSLVDEIIRSAPTVTLPVSREDFGVPANIEPIAQDAWS